MATSYSTFLETIKSLRGNEIAHYPIAMNRHETDIIIRFIRADLRKVNLGNDFEINAKANGGKWTIEAIRLWQEEV